MSRPYPAGIPLPMVDSATESVCGDYVDQIGYGQLFGSD